MPADKVNVPIVTARGPATLESLEAAAPADSAPSGDPITRALTINRYRHAAEALEREAADVDPDVFISVQDREASLLQSAIADAAAEDHPAVERTEVAPGVEEVKFGKGLEDPWGWSTSLFDWVDRMDAHHLVRPSGDTPATLPDTARVALVADWATALYGAPVTAQTLRDTGRWDLLMHLGDVYYSGTVKEVATRFTSLWPADAADINRAINGNHEMYSGGYGYYDHVLPAFGQDGSYFALQNEHWLLIGLDTAWVDHDMDAEQVGWVSRVVKAAGKRRVLLFSHQQLFSNQGSQGPKLHTALRGLLTSKLVTAWYWGHEHDCALYDPHPTYGLRGRLLGNGGVPEKRRGHAQAAPVEAQQAGVAWHRLPATSNSPSCLALDGPNPYIVGKEEKFMPHGYMTLELDGPKLTERVHLPDGTSVWENELA